MLKRACLSLEIAIVAAVLGFSGLLRATAPIAQIICFLSLAFAVVSLLFSLFEEATESTVRKLEISEKVNPAAYQLVLDFSY